MKSCTFIAFVLVVVVSAALARNAHAQFDDGEESGPVLPETAFLPSGEEVAAILGRTSLMLTPGELSGLESARLTALDTLAQRDLLADEEDDANFTEPIADNDFVLDAIMYAGPSNWTIWLNGQAVKPDKTPEDVRIVMVTPQSAEILWFRDAEGETTPRQFTLLPGQIYLSESGEIIEASQRRAEEVPERESLEQIDAEADGEREVSDVPEELDPVDAQLEEIEELQELLGLLPEGALPAGQAGEIEALQESLDASSGEGLNAEQIQQLQDIQSLIQGGE